MHIPLWANALSYLREGRCVRTYLLFSPPLLLGHTGDQSDMLCYCSPISSRLPQLRIPVSSRAHCMAGFVSLTLAIDFKVVAPLLLLVPMIDRLGGQDNQRVASGAKPLARNKTSDRVMAAISGWWALQPRSLPISFDDGPDV